MPFAVFVLMSLFIDDSFSPTPRLPISSSPKHLLIVTLSPYLAIFLLERANFLMDEPVASVAFA